jgi:ABC-type dipeptide/oligopeptide/nickel transport system permease subunit
VPRQAESSRIPHRPRRFAPTTIIGAITLSIVVLACFASAPWTLGWIGGGATPPYRDARLDAYFLPPAWIDSGETERSRRREHPEIETKLYVLGTDNLGRDLFVRCLLGGSISLGVGFSAALISVLVGTLYGAIAGAAGGRVDAVMMRIVDVLYGLPYILLVVLLAVGADALIDRWAGGELSSGKRTALNVLTLLIAIGGVSWLTMARVIRGQVLSLKSQPFMEAARAIGAPVHRQFFRHLLPNLVGPIVVYATLTVPQAILQESFLSFLGIGIQAPLPSWGNLTAAGLSELNTVNPRWWLLLFPSLLLGVTLLALNFVGEGLREALDPRSERSA